MTVRSDTTGENADLAVGDLARRTRILPCDASGRLALFQKPRLVDDENRIFVGQRLQSLIAHDVAQRLGVPASATTNPSAAGRRQARYFIIRATELGEHPQRHLAKFSGILQADAYGGYGKLYEPERRPGPIAEAACWSHARRKFFVLADVESNARRKAASKTPSIISPLALEAVRRIDALFEIERSINGFEADKRKAARQERSAPLVADLNAWMRLERGKLSRHNDVAKAMDYMLKRWDSFARFLDDGRICLSNNAAERALRGIVLGRKSWLFAGSDRGGERAAVMYSLIVTAKMNDIDPQAWFADVLARIADHPAQKLDELMPWNWAAARNSHNLAA